MRDRLEELARVYDVDECIVLTITYNYADRLRSYELVAKEFGLERIDDAFGLDAVAKESPTSD